MEQKNEKLQEALRLLYNWTDNLCQYAGKDNEYRDWFWKELLAIPELLQEYAYYYDNQDFLCRYSIEDYTLADILIWEMDHFRSNLDRTDGMNRHNKDKLLLESFATMIKMKKEPAKYKSQFQSETGTDLDSGWKTY